MFYDISTGLFYGNVLTVFIEQATEVILQSSTKYQSLPSTAGR